MKINIDRKEWNFRALKFDREVFFYRPNRSAYLKQICLLGRCLSKNLNIIFFIPFLFHPQFLFLYFSLFYVLYRIC
jgi:hypothetical protein